MFKIEMLPAGRGDCLLIEYGEASSPRRILVDGGLGATGKLLRSRLENLPKKDRRFDLLIVTHIDLDHIAGVLELLRNPPESLDFDQVWFNAWEHLPEDPALLGPKQGESLSTLIQRRGYQWNQAFGGGPVGIADGASELPTWKVPGTEMKLTLLSPTLSRLSRLRRDWKKVILEAGMEPGRAGEVLEEPAHPEDVSDPGILGAHRTDLDQLVDEPFKKDSSAANGSSIAVLAEFENKRLLLAGDAFAPDVVRSLERIEPAGRIEVSALKLAHHGGKKNTSPDLIKKLACRHYLFSSDGSYYDHPDSESVARVVYHGRAAGVPQLYFNYRSEDNEIWDDRRLKRRHRFDTVFPDSDPGLAVEL